MRRARPTPGTVIPAHAGIQSTERKECAWKNSRLSTCLQVTVTERCMPVSPVICSSAHGNTATMSWMAFPTSTGSGCWSGSNSRSEEHTSELQSRMRISYAVFCLKQKKMPSASSKQKEHTTTTDITYQIEEYT